MKRRSVREAGASAPCEVFEGKECADREDEARLPLQRGREGCI